MTGDRKLTLHCQCAGHCCVGLVTHWLEWGDHDEQFQVELYEHVGGRSLRLRERLKIAWGLVRRRDPHPMDLDPALMLSSEQASELGRFLIDGTDRGAYREACERALRQLLNRGPGHSQRHNNKCANEAQETLRAAISENQKLTPPEDPR